MSTIKIALVISAVATLAIAVTEPTQARPVWYGPGSGPISPYSNYKGFAQLPRQPSGSIVRGRTTSNVSQPYSGTYRCVPNVGLVGANGICP